MKIDTISFKNYKAFHEKQTMKIKPITILIGKNSSGKSSIAKLFTLLEKSLAGEIDEPLQLKNNGVEIGGEFDNLFFGNKRGGAGLPLNFCIKYTSGIEIEVGIFNRELGFGLYIHQWKYKDKTKNFELEYKENNEYIDSISNKTYICEFKGFIPKLFKEKDTGLIISDFEIEKIDVDYIGPFRILPERYFYLTGKSKFSDTGVTGENAYEMLGISKLTKDDSLHENVGSWYKENFDNWELKVDDKSNKPLIQILLSKDEMDINIVDVGQGMNQALPLVVRANVADKPNSLIVLEQPELHLHPAAHSDLAELFAKSAKKYNQSFIIETHSENMILRLRKLVIENDFGFTSDDIVIYSVDNAEQKGQELLEITIDKDGVLSDWPDGVFTEGLKEILEIQKALSRIEEK